MRNLFFCAILLTSGFASAATQVNYRPYISCGLAKVILARGDNPDNDVKILCDGSGWITHGDGHKTPCPGCDAIGCPNATTKDVEQYMSRRRGFLPRIFTRIGNARHAKKGAR